MVMRTIEWKNGVVCLIDQTKLPGKVSMVKCTDPECVARAIETMQIRGAPAIGVAAAMGVALAAERGKGLKLPQLKERLADATERLASTRPTARNLFWALQRMEGVWKAQEEVDSLVLAVVKEAKTIAEEDVVRCRFIGSHGADLIKDGDQILTHCNAGGLACVEHGTALGVIKSAFGQGKKIFVYATETRPLLQGARLTAFELKEAGIPFKLITDNMVGYVMKRGLVNKVVVGADRITKEGDVVNKIGTYGIAVLAKSHGIPFYVAAPTSTIDPTVKAEDIAIEERKAEEVLRVGRSRVAPKGTAALNPAFDLTPKELVSAIVTEDGVFRPPYDFSPSRAR
jgi:methylthioribose-1-phosphate isomerase